MNKEVPRQVPQGFDGLVAEALGRDGIFTAEDARRWDVSPAALTRALKRGRVERLLPRVYAVSGVSSTWWMHARAATAWSKGALSHQSAAFAHGLLEDQPTQFEVVTEKMRKPPNARVRCHASNLIGPPHVLVLRGIPVTAPARTLLDIAARVPEELLENALEEALRRGLVSMARLDWQLRTEGGRGRDGTAPLRALLEARGPGLAATESQLETRVARWFRTTSLPPPVRQHRVFNEGRFVARIDFAYPDARVGIEATSFRWHSGRNAWLKDENRHRALRDLGWRIVYVLNEDITRRGVKLESEIAHLLGLTLL